MPPTVSMALISLTLDEGSGLAVSPTLGQLIRVSRTSLIEAVLTQPPTRSTSRGPV
jgi:hypothetical protein